jgi:hypothetical protein
MVFIVYYYFVFFLKPKNINTHLPVIIILLVMFLWINEYYMINNIQNKSLNTPYLFNNLLFNSLNKYHPVLFFLSYLYIYKTLGFGNLYNNYINNNWGNFTYSINYKVMFIKNINLL